MPRIKEAGLRRLLGVGIVVGLIVGLQPTLRAAEDDRTNIHIVVMDAESGQPINQARLTLQFREASRTMNIKHSKMISFSAKTNQQGRYRFTDIPKGTVRLMVTSEGHASYGKNIEIEKDNQEIEVKLKKPQPQL